MFTDPTVSRRHASLRRRNDRWTVHDLGSSNGTWLNGMRVERAGIQPGDQLRFGELTAQVIGR